MIREISPTVFFPSLVGSGSVANLILPAWISSPRVNKNEQVSNSASILLTSHHSWYWLSTWQALCQRGSPGLHSEFGQHCPFACCLRLNKKGKQAKHQRSSLFASWPQMQWQQPPQAPAAGTLHGGPVPSNPEPKQTFPSLSGFCQLFLPSNPNGHAVLSTDTPLAQDPSQVLLLMQ